MQRVAAPAGPLLFIATRLSVKLVGKGEWAATVRAQACFSREPHCSGQLNRRDDRLARTSFATFRQGWGPSTIFFFFFLFFPCGGGRASGPGKVGQKSSPS
jgi:hypothetical protein